MGLKGKLIAAVEFRAGRDLFQLIRDKPDKISGVSPQKVQGFDLIEGEFVNVGSIFCWKYTHDGKEKLAKEVIQVIDEEKKLIEYKMLEGTLMEEYKDFLITFHVENKDGVNLVSWTLEYETLNDDVRHPISTLSFFIDLTKDIENYLVGKP